jgi:WXXGXW repeat (2 copies)
MNAKSCLLSATFAAALFATPAFADVSLSIGIGVPVAPPAPVYELAPSPPAVGYVWAPGYWAWLGNRYIWVHGRYIYGRPGYAWHPEHWEHRGDRWHFVRGGWDRERHERREHERHERHDRGHHR